MGSMPRSKYPLSKPWSGSQHDQFRAIAAAVQCSPYTVRRWAREGSISAGLLSFLEEDNSAKYRTRRDRNSDTP